MTSQKLDSLSASFDPSLVEYVLQEGRLIAIIVKSRFDQTGINFFTPPELSQQLAYMRHPTGKVIEPHTHNRVQREVHSTQEVLVLKKGRLRVDFYTSERAYVESRMLEAGDIILLIEGGHGFKVIEEIEMIEIKQGPYIGDKDKTFFVGIKSGQATIKRRGVMKFHE